MSAFIFIAFSIIIVKFRCVVDCIQDMLPFKLFSAKNVQGVIDLLIF